MTKVLPATVTAHIAILIRLSNRNMTKALPALVGADVLDTFTREACTCSEILAFLVRVRNLADASP